MPEISRFFGIVIGMFYNEHGVPHLHTVYGEFEATIELQSERVHGHLPRRALGLILEGRDSIDKYCWTTGIGLGTASLWLALHRSGSPMDYHVLEARRVAGHTVWLRFRDGTTGEVDLAEAFKGPVYEPLGDVACFAASAFIRSSTRSCGRMVPTWHPNFFTRELGSRPNAVCCRQPGLVGSLPLAFVDTILSARCRCASTLGTFSKLRRLSERATDALDHLDESIRGLRSEGKQ